MTIRLGSRATTVAAIVFDLDDTLVDTFNLLIKPLENEAAAAMIAAGIGASDHSRLAEIILDLRKNDPENVEERLLQQFPQAAGRTLEARRAVFVNASPDKLTIKPEIKHMLEELRAAGYDTYLVTTGPREFQDKKIDQLGIRDLFLDTEVLESGSEITKERWLDSLARQHGYNKAAVVVVGNRLDNEIQAGNQLGMITVWVRYGEGSGLNPCQKTGQPDYTISDIAEFPGVLAKLQSSCATG